VGYKVAVVGRRELLSIYEVLGIDIYDARTREEVLRTLRELKDYGLVLIDEEFSSILEVEREERLPVLGVIPTQRGVNAKNFFSNFVIRAVGTKIFSEGNSNEG
jgi:vacuolar-type H+-ATPase subunit F/Vma7